MTPATRVGKWLGWLGVLSIVAVIATATEVVSGRRLADDWADEAQRLVRLASLRGDMVAAEIGAGRGELTVEVARHLAPSGRLYSTEIDSNRLEDIRRAVADAGLDNVTVLGAGARDSNLPAGCCDLVYMREVYHHFDAAAAITASIHRALKPGGRLAIIDFPERDARGGDCHCIAKAELIKQVTEQGFEVVEDVDRWTSSHYLVLFRKHEGAASRRL